jgi:hypothetical protein
MAPPKHPLCLLSYERRPIGTTILEAITVPHGECSNSGYEFPAHYAEAISNIGRSINQPKRKQVSPGLARGGYRLPRQNLNGKYEEVIWDRMRMRAMHHYRIPSASQRRRDGPADLRGLFNVHASYIVYEPAGEAGAGFDDETPHFQGRQECLRGQNPALIQITPGKAGLVCSFH